MKADLQVVADAFFLPLAGGGRYCMYYPVPADMACRGSILLIPPFGEELNRTRRLAAQQARLLAAMGFAVMQIDLYGCGDSAGELRDASWEMWLDDLDAAYAWIHAKVDHVPTLWAVRLGALLASDFAARMEGTASHLLLWAPVVNGQLYVRQLLRQHLVGQMLDENTEAAADAAALRKKLSNGETVEVAGYELPAELMMTIEARHALGAIPRFRHVSWFDINTNAGQSIPIATRQLIDGWTAAHIEVQYLPVQAPQFWSIQDTLECPELLRATCAALMKTVL